MYLEIVSTLGSIIVIEYLCRMTDSNLAIKPSNIFRKMIEICNQTFYNLGYMMAGLTDVIGLAKRIINKLWDILQDLYRIIKDILIHLRKNLIRLVRRLFRMLTDLAKFLRKVLLNLNHILKKTPLYDFIKLLYLMLEMLASFGKFFIGFNKYFEDLFATVRSMTEYDFRSCMSYVCVTGPLILIGIYLFVKEKCISNDGVICCGDNC